VGVGTSETKQLKDVKMSIEIETSALSMSGSPDSLKTTPPIMHRIHFEVQGVDTWYALHAEAKTMFGKNYRSQKHVKKRIERAFFHCTTNHCVWFDVPDLGFGTWCAIKHAVTVVDSVGK